APATSRAGRSARRRAARRATLPKRPAARPPAGGERKASGWRFLIRDWTRSPGGCRRASPSAAGWRRGRREAASRSRRGGWEAGPCQENSFLPMHCHRCQFESGRALSQWAEVTMKGRGVLITGGRKGLGAALAEELSGAGARVVLVARAMALRGSGLVLHVSSDTAVAAYPRWGAYGVSKAALDHMNRIWALELAQTGVRFLSVDPGEMDTEMHAAAMPEADRAELAQPVRVARWI